MKYKSVNDIKGSKSFLALNANLFVGGLPRQQPQPRTRPALEQQPPQGKGGERRMAGGGQEYRVTLTRHGRRLCDSDNNSAAMKPLRDAIARWLGVDDADKFVDWQYGQVRTRGRCGTVVVIEKLG